jgi:hypothetical protein
MGVPDAWRGQFEHPNMTGLKWEISDAHRFTFAAHDHGSNG